MTQDTRSPHDPQPPGLSGSKDSLPGPSVESDRPEIRLREALDCLWRGDDLAGIERLRKLVCDHPDFLEGWGNLGHHLYLRGDLEGTIECCNRLLEIQPLLVEPVIRMAESYYALGNRRKAHAIYCSQAAKPFYRSADWQQRLALTSPLWKRAIKNAAPVLRTAARRLSHPGFVANLAREIGLLPFSLDAIRRSGWGSYWSYLNQHYLTNEDYRFPRIPCDLCGSERHRPIFFHRHVKIIKCLGCGLESVERKPPEGQDVADGAFERDDTLQAFEGMWNDPVLFEVRKQYLVDLYSQAGKAFPAAGERVLEIGCGQGHKIKDLADAGMKVVGTETGEKVVAQAREKFGLEVYRKTVRELDWPNETFDHILAYHVLEHLDHPSELFRQAGRLLSPGGWLFLEVPASNLLEMSLIRQINDAAGYGNPAHMYFFQPETLAKYFPMNGFELVSSYLRVESHFPVGGFLGRRRDEGPLNG